MRAREPLAFLTALSLLIFWFCATPSHATTMVGLDLVQLSANADAIAHGRVVDVRSEWAPGRRRVQTRVSIVVSEYYKGQLGSEVTLIVPGGRMGRYRSVFVGAPHFEVGERVVVFLGQGQREVPYLIGFSQGLFRVVSDSATGQEVVTPRPLMATGTAPERVRRGDRARTSMSLTEFRSVVRRLASRPVR